MFPIAFSPGNIDGRRVQPDDIAGVSDIYPDDGFREATGSVSGRVTKDGLGVFGAHVVAMHLRTGALVGGFTLDQTGTFVLAGLEPGPVVLRVEPLDDGDVTSFIDGPRVDLDFQVAFSPRTIFVPRGGNAPDVTIEVRGESDRRSGRLADVSAGAWRSRRRPSASRGLRPGCVLARRQRRARAGAGASAEPPTARHRPAAGAAGRDRRARRASFGGAELGQTPATVLTNQVPTSGQTSLFTTRTEITPAPWSRDGSAYGWRDGCGWRQARPMRSPTSRWTSRVTWRGRPDVTASSRLTQIVADAGLQYRWSGRRVSPFVMGGGGYLRQLDESRTTVESGAMYYGGGGVVVRLAPASRGCLAAAGAARRTCVRCGCAAGSRSRTNVAPRWSRPAGFRSDCKVGRPTRRRSTVPTAPRG